MRPGIAGLFLHGAAGIGKSVLAAHIAGRICSEHPGTQVTTVTGVLTVEQLAAILVPDSPSLVVLDQFEANVLDGTIADRGLAAVLVYLAEAITGKDSRPGHARIIVTARQPLALGRRILVRHVGPLTRWSADEFASSLPRLRQLTGAQREYAWRLTAGHPGCLRSLDARLADATFAELADNLAETIAVRTGRPAGQVFPADLDPVDAAAIASVAGSVLNPAEAGTAPEVVAVVDAAAPDGLPGPGHGPRRPRSPRLLMLTAALAVAAIAWAPFAVRSLVPGGARTVVAVRAQQPARHHEQTAAAARAPAAAAAAWLAANLTRGTPIGCDQAMCASLSQHGLGRASLSQLRPGGDLAADGLIVSTPRARTLMNSAIEAAAPELAASFGTGAGRVEIREVTPGGAAAYNSWRLAADLASRRNGGNLMLGNPSIRETGDTWVTLAVGHVDSRILLALAEMAHSAPLTIVSFGAANPGAPPEVPLRSVLIDVADPAAAAAYLKVQDPVMQPLAVRLGHASLWVEFGAPSPLGLFQARS
jgi:hypothetical protein